MTVLVIDGQGGKIGRLVIELLRQRDSAAEIVAVGTNSAATETMLKAGAQRGATGENSVVVACRSADYIIGPIGIVVADSMLGEITPKMSVAVGQSTAKKVLIPMSRCETAVAGVSELPLSTLIEDAVKKLK